MTVAAPPTTETQSILCWCGADETLQSALRDLSRHDLGVVKTPSEFLEAFHDGVLPRYVVLGGKPASETLRLLNTVQQETEDIPVLVALSDPSPDDVRLFLRKGAADILWVDELEAGLAEKIGAPERPVAPSSPHRTSCELICLNERMRKIEDIARRIAPTDSTVLVQGESGTGKELIAALIHEGSRRREHPFVTVNCGAIPESLLESQLYGHEKGSFTGAVKQQKGLFEVADHGTIFLDEIGEMGLEMQVKLLRFLQSREFRRVGGSSVLKVSVRVLAASNRDLKEEVARGRFRMDLFYRINVITLIIPPLRERPEEIPALVNHFVSKLSREKNVAPRTFTPEAVARLRALSWPGNVRELENAVERLLLLAADDVVCEDDLAEFLEVPDSLSATPGEPPIVTAATGSGQEPVLPTLAEVERAHIDRALTAHKWNKMRTARVLGINVKTLYNKIRAYRLIPPPDQA